MSPPHEVVGAEASGVVWVAFENGGVGWVAFVSGVVKEFELVLTSVNGVSGVVGTRCDCVDDGLATSEVAIAVLKEDDQDNA